ncbi:MAG: hypothetical protein HY927_10035 [Elusimicrobia bacterium]|nr:hypothetical protein [Elusimicrobiota bacterium]
MKRIVWIVALAVLGGCQTLDTDRGLELDQETSDVDFQVKESKTLSILAKIETAVADYVKTEKEIPPKLTALVPKYLADIPLVELPGTRHKDSSAVQYYPSSIIHDGVIDGTLLKDSGKWGYVFTDRQVIVFIDCTHRSSKGVPWYQARGVY